MTKNHTLAGLIILVIGSLLITACAAQQNETPTATVDANLIYTQAAETVTAGLSQTEAAKPTAAATETVAPTSTTDPIIAAGMTSTANAVLNPAATSAAPTAAVGQATPTTQVILPTATIAVVSTQAQTSGDKAELVSQSPSDNSSVDESATFTAKIVLKNIGTTTWTTGYNLAFYAGDKMGSPTDFDFPHEVKPGETVELVFDMKASDDSGSKRTIWAVQNANGVNFYTLWLEMKVIDNDD